jgi:bifunctional non-homologous end joining protein LigD
MLRSQSAARHRSGPHRQDVRAIGGVLVSRPDKIMYPDQGITKAEVAVYYHDVADVMLPHLTDRPITMQRWPNGVDGQSFYEKKVPNHFPDWSATATVGTSDGPQRQLMVQDIRTLTYLADQACLTPHTWLSRVDDLDRPDQLIIDLDPSSDDLAAVRHATMIVGEALDDLGLVPFLKTTGSRGYHVLTPIKPALGFADVRKFARSLADTLAGRHPDLLTTEQRKDRRDDRVFVDVLRNGYGQTAAPPYALRGRPGAPVATPLDWEELPRTAPDRFDISSVRRRLQQRDCPWRNLRRHARTLGRVIDRLDRR